MAVLCGRTDVGSAVRYCHHVVAELVVDRVLRLDAVGTTMTGEKYDDWWLPGSHNIGVDFGRCDIFLSGTAQAAPTTTTAFRRCLLKLVMNSTDSEW